MMNKDTIHRLKKAAGYQRQAILALLPEGMDSHIEVIENEIKKMFEETVTNVIFECRQENEKTDTKDDNKKTGIKKVTID